jgi:hypothetical protein
MGLYFQGKDCISKTHIPSSLFSPSYFGARGCELFAKEGLQSGSSLLTLSSIKIIGLSH